MSLPERSPHIRVLPHAATLDIILKNTHFPDDLLDNTSPIQCAIEWKDSVPVLVFRFKNTAYDFNEPLLSHELKNGERGWLNQSAISVRLLLANSVIADHVTERKFILSKNDSQSVKEVLGL
ncbi:hypothetical protein [Dyadobacter sp. 676]|uniref:Uncharacterized protein n=1 Tax=Dyadobacter sp. 676 TaxID=3088362 RepID=A0AAU8FFJ8_9BACT